MCPNPKERRAWAQAVIASTHRALFADQAWKRRGLQGRLQRRLKRGEACRSGLEEVMLADDQAWKRQGLQGRLQRRLRRGEACRSGLEEVRLAEEGKKDGASVRSCSALGGGAAGAAAGPLQSWFPSSRSTMVEFRASRLLARASSPLSWVPWKRSTDPISPLKRTAMRLGTSDAKVISEQVGSVIIIGWLRIGSSGWAGARL